MAKEYRDSNMSLFSEALVVKRNAGEDS